MKNKVLLIILTLTCILTSVNHAFAEYAPQKEVYTNVAQNKPIKMSAYTDACPKENMVDGNINTFIEPYTATNTWYTDNEDGVRTDGNGQKYWFSVDLQRRYNIERIELYDHNQAGGRQNFKILASNNPDFPESETVELGRIGNPNDELFPKNGAFVIDLDGTEAYRYVKMQRFGGYWYGYTEFKVFAKQTVTDMAYLKNAYTDDCYSEEFGAYKAVNGTNADSSDAWVVTNSNRYHYLAVDLEKDCPIGMVELQGRNGQDDANGRFYFSIYGAKSFDPEDSADTELYTNTRYIKDVEGVKRLMYFGEDWPGRYAMPKFDPSKEEETTLRITLDESESYKWAIFKREYDNRWQLGASALGAFRVFVVNPVVNKMDFSGNEITLYFSDEMNFDTMESGIELTVESTGEKLDLSTGDFNVSALDDYTALLTVNRDIYGEDISLSVKDSVKSKKGTPAKEYNKVLKADPAITVTAFKIIDEIDKSGNVLDTIANAQKAGAEVVIKNNLPVESKASQVVVIGALTDKDNILRAASEIRINPDPAQTETYYTGLDLSEYEDLSGYTFSVYIWNGFKTMKSWTEFKKIN